MTVTCINCNGCFVFPTTDLTCLFCSYMTLGAVCSSTCPAVFSWRSCSCSVSHLVNLSCSCGARLRFPPTYEPLLPFSVVVSVFHHSLPSSPFFFFFFLLCLLLFLAVWTSLPSLLWTLSLCLWDQGPFARLRTFWNSTHSMGWMGKRGALTSLLWKVTHLGLVFGVCFSLPADSVLVKCCASCCFSCRATGKQKSPHNSHNSFKIMQMFIEAEIKLNLGKGSWIQTDLSSTTRPNVYLWD